MESPCHHPYTYSYHYLLYKGLKKSLLSPLLNLRRRQVLVHRAAVLEAPAAAQTTPAATLQGLRDVPQLETEVAAAAPVLRRQLTAAGAPRDAIRLAIGAV